MSSSFFGLLQVLPAFVTLTAQWVGVIAMRDERTGAWWTMMVGTAMTTLGALFSIVSMAVMFAGSSSIVMLTSVVGFHTLGALVFASGFAMHGLRRKASREREQQLEAVTAAMSEELRVARERGR
jgi:hypothetical protein